MYNTVTSQDFKRDTQLSTMMISEAMVAETIRAVGARKIMRALRTLQFVVRVEVWWNDNLNEGVFYCFAIV